MTNFDYKNWPPQLTDEQLEQLSIYATTYALSHGLLYLPPTPTDQLQPLVPASAIHAPISLFPAPFPRKLFEHAQKLQHAYNVLYARVALDIEFLDRVMGAEKGVGVVDDFVGQLWKGWKKIRDDGVPRPLQLGLFRSDYLLHDNESQPLSLKQVEFNTISSSFGTLSERTAALHRHLEATIGYYGVSSVLQPENFPPNETTSGLARGLAAAHAAYGVEGAYILFVVQPGERNVFDQRWLEYELLDTHRIRVIRQTFDELINSASIYPDNNALYLSVSTLSTSPIEISTIYFRAGYTPNDYPTEEHYAIRFLLERSKAINCPSIPLQLAGGKKVQEVLTQPGVLERFISPSDGLDLDALRASWMSMWGLDISEDLVTPDLEAQESGREEFGVVKARRLAGSLVLKPQREGGGNNVYKESIPEFLDKLPVIERQAWIAMELIRPPENVGGYLVRSGTNEAGSKAVKAEVVSELGIFGWALFGDGGGGVKVEDQTVGWLVRTKGKESNEGGVATGFSVLDSIVLVN